MQENDNADINKQDAPKHGKVTITLEDVDGVTVHAECVIDKDSQEGSFSESTKNVLALSLFHPSRTEEDPSLLREDK